jgi:hypothetical protein
MYANYCLLLLLHDLRVSTQPSTYTLVTRNHESTSRRDFTTSRRQTRHEGPKAFRLDDVYRKWDGRSMRIECSR